MKEHKLPHGLSIIGFDSFEEMQAHLEKQERAAIERTLPEQWDIDWGSYVFRMSDDLAIFGKVVSESEFIAQNTSDGEATSDEIIAELEGLRESFTRGYRYGRWFSEVEPEGELGSAHVAVLWEIEESDFDHARTQGWLVWPELAARLLREMRAAKDKADGKSE